MAAAFVFTGAAGAEATAWAVAGAALLPAVLLTLVIHIKARGRAMLMGIIIAGLIGVFIVRRHFEEHLSFGDHPWLAPVLLISALAFALGVPAARQSLVRIVISGCALILLALSLLSFINVHAAGVFCAMGFILFSVVTEVSARWKKEGSTDLRMYMICTAPFLAVIVLGAALIHYPDEPYDWQFFINAWSRIVRVCERISFSFDSGRDLITGFSDDGMLKTSLRGENKEVLSLTTLTDVNAPVYMAGVVFDTFDGHGWKMKDTSDYAMHAMDAAESISSVLSVGLARRDYYKDVPIVLEYTDSKTKYLFAPTKLTQREPISGKIGYSEVGGTFMFDKYNTWHLKVSETYIRPNADNPGFYEFMEHGGIPDEEVWFFTSEPMKSGKQDDSLTFDRYLEYVRHVKDTYTTDITLSEDLETKLDELYEGSVSDYERMKRLERALSVMEYSLDPPDIPASVKDPSAYLDFFLLESRRGYCSYYASAFVLLAREQGLPARYVQGYRVPVGRKGTYRVTTDMAHAWPEVYFEGRGWMAFDPTPGFFKESEWTMSTIPAANDTSAVITPDVFERAESVTVEVGSEEETEEEQIRVNLSVVAVPMAAVLVFLAMFLLIGRLIGRARFARLDDIEKLTLISKDCLDILRLAGCGIRAGETLSEYRNRIGKETGEEALSFIPCYESVLYNDSVSALPDTANTCRPILMEYLKKKSRFRYIYKVVKG